MRSNESAREAQSKQSPKLAEAMKIHGQTQEAMKFELIRLVLESRMSRLKNYKLTGDSKIWDKDYPERVKKIEVFLQAVSGNSMTKDGIISAANELGYKEKALVNDSLLPLLGGNVEGLQQVALQLMRADNGTEQVEAVAARTLSNIFAQGGKKLEGDSSSLTEIKRRANRDYGDMLRQGVFDQATPAQQQAVQTGIEAMYQMRFIAKNYIDEKGGISVPSSLRNVWENYRDSLDIKDEWFTLSDSGKTQFANFLLYDLAPMIISGGVAGAVGKGIMTVGARGTAALASRMPAAAGYLQSTARTATVVRNVGVVGGRAGVAVTEAVIFDTTFEGIRNQRWFTEKPSWQQDMLKNALGFGFSRYLAGAKSFAGMKLDPASNQLIKQGLIVPAIITGAGVADKLRSNDPDAYNGAWEEFLLGAIMIGAFHTTGKVLEARTGGQNIGVKKVEPSPDGATVTATTSDGKKFTLPLTDKLRLTIAYLRDRADEALGKGKKTKATEPETQSPEKKDGDKVDKTQTGKSLNDAEITRLESLKGSLQSKIEAAKRKLGEIIGTEEGRYLTAKTKLDAIPKGTGETGIKIEGSEFTINKYPDGKKIDVVRKGRDGVQTFNSIDEFLASLFPERNFYIAKTKLDAIPKGTGETGIKIEGSEFTINKYPDGKKIDVVRKGRDGVQTFNSIDEFLLSVFPEGIPARFRQSQYAYYQGRTLDSEIRIFENNTPESIQREIERLTAQVRDIDKAISQKKSMETPVVPEPRANLEKTIAKTEAALSKMRVDLKALQDQLINKEWSNPTARMHADDAIASLREQIAKKQADISRAEKHLAELNAIKKVESETPLRRERRERVAELQGRRNEFKALSPEERATELARVKSEGAEFRLRKDDYAKNLEANKDKITWDERRKIEKDIEQLDKKILANKAQENMMMKLERDIKKADDDLRAVGLNPDEIKTLAETPTGRKKLTSWLEEKRKLDGPQYMKILAAVLAALLLVTLYRACGDGKIPPHTNPPPTDGGDPGSDIEAVCGIDSGKEKGVLIDKRKSNEGIILTESRRKDISQRYMNTPKWKEVVNVFKSNESLFENSKFSDSFRAMLNSPNPRDIQHIQRWIGMESVDNETAQDGILGPNTAKALIDFMNKCKKDQNIPKAPPRPPVEE